MSGARTRRKGLREALAQKKVRIEHFPIPLSDAEIIDPLAERLQLARNVALRASLDDDQKAKDDAAAKVKAAEAEVDKHFWKVGFKGLTSDADFDALINAHPATEAQKAAAKADGTEDDVLAKMVDLDEFYLALLAVCAVDTDGMTADEWRAELWSERWTKADRKALFATVDRANRRDFSGLLPNA